LDPLIAVLLGIVEGLTEYLPVSSTGHLVLVNSWLNLTDEGSKSFDIVIQAGAILAVVVHYRKLLGQRLVGLLRRDPEALRLLRALCIAFLPAAFLGFLFHGLIKQYLFGPVPVAAALVVGGVLMIGLERWRQLRGVQGEEGLAHVDGRRALWIGIGQCFALWPGASRSMCTIVAGQFSGLSTATAAEFSFLLALPTLLAATLYESIKGREELAATVGASSIWIGLIVSFVVAWAVIAGFLAYLKRYGLAPFGYYRIALGLLVLFLAR
jgi:undecaprenyl-diphosphatase